MPFNVELLREQLDTAGIPVDGCNSDGTVWYRPEATELQRQQGDAIVAAHNPTGLTEQQKVDAARAAIQDGKRYLAKQLIKSSPDSPAQIVSVLKPAVDGNEYLLNMMTNQLTSMNIAYAWLVLDINQLLSPATAANRQRYILAAQAIIGMLG